MSNISKSLTTGNFELNITPTTSAQTTTLKVGGTYCDTDIDVKVSAVQNASTFSLAITDKASTDITVGTKSGSYYPLSTSLTGTFSAGTAGWFSSGSATDSSVIVGRIAATAYTTSSSSNSGTNQISNGITPSSSIQYVNISAGYTPKSYIKINAVDAVLTVNGSSPDSNGNAQITSVGATTSDTMPNSLVQYGNFLKLIKVRA